MREGGVATKGVGAPGLPVDDSKIFFKLCRTETLRTSVGTRFRNEIEKRSPKRAEGP
jgi:hypothetical protein